MLQRNKHCKKIKLLLKIKLLNNFLQICDHKTNLKFLLKEEQLELYAGVGSLCRQLPPPKDVGKHLFLMVLLSVEKQLYLVQTKLL